MPSRREFAVGSCSAVAALALAGCLGNGDDDANGDDENGDNGDNGEANGNGDDTSENGENGGESVDEIDFEPREPGEFATVIYEKDDRPVVIDCRKPKEQVAAEGIEPDGEDEIFGTPQEEIDYLATGATEEFSYTFLFGPFDVETVEQEIEASGEYTEFTAVDAYGEFQTFEATLEDGGTHLYGHSEDGILQAESRESYEQVIDAVVSDGSRLIDTDETFETVAEAIGDPDMLTLYLEPAPEQMVLDPSGEGIAGAAGYDLASEESDYRAVILYESEDAAREHAADVESTVAETISGLEITEAGVHGRKVLVQGTIPTNQIE